jgi:hypothetical protein
MKKTLITTSLIAALFAVPAMATQDEIDQKTVTSKYYVDQELATKQNTIATDKVLFFDGQGKETSIYVPAIVATNAAGTALNGNTIGVLDYTASTQSVNGHNFDLTNYSNQKYDDFVPTVRAVAQALDTINSNNLNFDADETDATNNYSTSFDDQKGHWPEGDNNRYVRSNAFAAGLALKQNKIEAGTAGNVITYTGTAGSVGSTAVSSAATYSGTTLTNGNNIANIAAVETAVGTKQDKMTCAGYLAGHENDEDYCWLYSVAPAAAAPQCLAYGEDIGKNGSASDCCSGVLQSGTDTCGCNDISDCPSNANGCDQTHVCGFKSKD